MRGVQFFRRAFPKNGRNYELFDYCTLLFYLIFVGYVLTTPGSTQEDALRGPFSIMPSVVWGIGMSTVAAYGMVASYIPRLVTSGYKVAFFGSLFWSTLFFVSIFLPDEGPVQGLTGLLEYSDLRVSILVVLYGWISRHLWREENRDYHETRVMLCHHGELCCHPTESDGR